MDATPILVPEPDPAEDAHTISRKGARMPQVEVITRGERRRVWTVEQKREIVAESLGSTLTPTEVARKHGISSGLLYGWRQKLIGGQMTLLQQSPPGFAGWRSRRRIPTSTIRSLRPRPRHPHRTCLSSIHRA